MILEIKYFLWWILQQYWWNSKNMSALANVQLFANGHHPLRMYINQSIRNLLWFLLCTSSMVRAYCDLGNYGCIRVAYPSPCFFGRNWGADINICFWPLCKPSIPSWHSQIETSKSGMLAPNVLVKPHVCFERSLISCTMDYPLL